MRDVSDDTRPFTEAWCEGTTPGGWRCASLIHESGDLLEEIEEEYGLLLCGDCQADYDIKVFAPDPESVAEAAWEWANNR